MRLTDPRVLALLAVLCVFHLLPHGFANADLRRHLAPLLGLAPEHMTSSQLTYDLRRLRLHGLIERIPGSFRYRVTDTGMTTAMFLTRLNQRVLRVGPAALTDPDPPTPHPCEPPHAPTRPPFTTSSPRPDSQPEPPPPTCTDSSRSTNLTQSSRPQSPKPSSGRASSRCKKF
jgi:hypothetical protein